MSDPTEPSDPEPVSKEHLGKLVSGCGVTNLGLFVLLLVASFVSGAFRSPPLPTLAGGVQLATLLANLAVSFYCFAAFTATKNRAFLCVAFAALSFSYVTLFTMLLGVRPPATAWHMTHSAAGWYYATRYIADLVGLGLYAYGVISLARSAAKKV